LSITEVCESKAVQKRYAQALFSFLTAHYDSDLQT
jgi:hypothetical protein